MKQIIILGSYPDGDDAPVSGPARYVAGLTSGLNKLGLRVLVVSAPYSHVAKRSESSIKPGLERLKVNPWRLLRLSVATRGSALHIATFSYVHAVPLLARAFLRLIGLHCGPVIYTINGVATDEMTMGYRGSRTLTRLVERLMLTMSDYLVAPSRIVLEAAQRAYPDLEIEATIIGHGVVDEFGSAEIERAGASQTEPRVLLAPGGLRHVKGLDFLVEALLKLQTDHSLPDWRLVVVGPESKTWIEPPGWDDLRNAGRIELSGAVDTAELGRLYRSSRAVVVVSRYEPFGQVVLEAMLAGAAVVISDRVGAIDSLDDETAVETVRFMDVEGLAAVLSRVLRDDSYLTDLRLRARRAVVDRSWLRIAHEYMAVYT